MRFSRLFAATLAVSLLFAAQANSATLSVEISGVSEAKGILSAKVSASADAHDGKSKPTAAERLTITSKDTVTLRFTDLKPGQYAVSVMHDENENGQLDSNIVGIPKEGYGFSNNPRVMRKPTFDEAKFELGASDLTIKIDLL